MSFVYVQKRPQLSIELVSSRASRSCWSVSTYRVTSWGRQPRSTLEALNKMGVLGTGQGFQVKSQCDGMENPAGFDRTECVDTETGACPAINPYNRKPYGPVDLPFYVYEVEATCDSGD